MAPMGPAELAGLDPSGLMGFDKTWMHNPSWQRATHHCQALTRRVCVCVCTCEGRQHRAACQCWFGLGVRRLSSMPMLVKIGCQTAEQHANAGLDWV